MQVVYFRSTIDVVDPCCVIGSVNRDGVVEILRQIQSFTH